MADEGERGLYAPWEQGLSSRERQQLRDRHYLVWRDRQIEKLDREYEEYCRECQQQFDEDFDRWRSSRLTEGGPAIAGASSGANEATGSETDATTESGDELGKSEAAETGSVASEEFGVAPSSFGSQDEPGFAAREEIGEREAWEDREESGGETAAFGTEPGAASRPAFSGFASSEAAETTTEAAEVTMETSIGSDADAGEPDTFGAEAGETERKPANTLSEFGDEDEAGPRNLG